MPQPAGEGLLRHRGIENFALEVVDGGILGARRRGKPGCKQRKCKDAASGDIQDYSQGYSRHDLIPK